METCHTPVSLPILPQTTHSLVSIPFTLTHALLPSYMLLTTVIRPIATPYSSNTPHSFSDSPCHTLSPDLQMQQILFFFTSKHLSITYCTVKIWSAQPLPGMKLHWTSQIFPCHLLYPANQNSFI
jgi:hypothetical protein